MAEHARISAIETRYAGCRFRSRLEARWAVFFDTHRIAWQYEAEGYELRSSRRYLPDFYLPSCGTWVEVKGASYHVDLNLLIEAAQQFTQPTYEQCGEVGPVLLLLGPIPEPLPVGDYGWLGFEPNGISRFGFGEYHKNQRPWWFDDQDSASNATSPSIGKWEANDAMVAYRAARSARFEHGEAG